MFKEMGWKVFHIFVCSALCKLLTFIYGRYKKLAAVIILLCGFGFLLVSSLRFLTIVYD
jgi:hypothetical protein